MLMFILLLTLSADVLNKFATANNDCGNITAQHIDELRENDFTRHKDFLQTCENMQRSTTSTIFTFLSPQFLVKHDNARDVFVRASHRRTVHLIIMDEIHLHVQNGESFSEECRELAVVFLRRCSITQTTPTLAFDF